MRWLSDNDFLGADGIKFEEGDWTQQQLDAAIDAAIFAQNKKITAISRVTAPRPSS